MIIWGSKGREIVESEGSFFCPECHKEANYLLKRVGQYFTFYFIPIFQTKKLGRFVECKSCNNQFKEKVLNYRPKKLFPVLPMTMRNNNLLLLTSWFRCK